MQRRRRCCNARRPALIFAAHIYNAATLVQWCYDGTLLLGACASSSLGCYGQRAYLSGSPYRMDGPSHSLYTAVYEHNQPHLANGTLIARRYLSYSSFDFIVFGYMRESNEFRSTAMMIMIIMMMYIMERTNSRILRFNSCRTSNCNMFPICEWIGIQDVNDDYR